ncbi:ribose 5-phosphate isomerase B [Caproiciproducens sp. NJN-50]|uniref:ribose 5-phosphate isomerase B n=1 Tax=Caproiciproducens sp. NJN-50 TaxID=2507162 RepID=UPI000FFE335E|nr:ribose 5-phosphate isomerase B [Caproiciproducens sp. NJN-50]QAT48987.1 ribose 5-phosphate isomerase B [Caproiciproducens sp. NJN-50]
MKLIVGSDEAAYDFKEKIKEYLISEGYEIVDKGTYDGRPVLYPDIAVKVAQAVADGEADRGILMCGTGIGMSISANKVPGIRAAVCHDCYSAERARKSNNAQILCMGARVIGLELAKQLADIWLASDFSGGRSQPKVDRISYYDDLYKKQN